MYDPDDALRMAVSEIVDDAIAENANPDDEVERIKSIATSLFWDAYNTRTADMERCADCGNLFDPETMHQWDEGDDEVTLCDECHADRIEAEDDESTIDDEDIGMCAVCLAVRPIYDDGICSGCYAAIND
jgi:hypothetical protein